MHVAFRLDIMRYLTLADALKQRYTQIRFVSRELPVHLRDMLAAKGMGFVSSTRLFASCLC